MKKARYNYKKFWQVNLENDMSGSKVQYFVWLLWNLLKGYLLFENISFT